MSNRAPRCYVGEPFVKDISGNAFEAVFALKKRIQEATNLENEWGAEDKHAPIPPAPKLAPIVKNVVKKVEPEPKAPGRVRLSDAERAQSVERRKLLRADAIAKQKAERDAALAALSPKEIAARKAQRRQNVSDSHRKWWSARISLAAIRLEHGIATEQATEAAIASGELSATRQSGTQVILRTDFAAWLATKSVD